MGLIKIVCLASVAALAQANAAQANENLAPISAASFQNKPEIPPFRKLTSAGTSATTNWDKTVLLNDLFGAETSPPVGNVVICFVIILTIGSLGSGAGVGGGGIFLPMFSFLLDLNIKNAGYATKATILGGSLGNMFYLSTRKHPKANRPIIDYELGTVMEASEILGAVVGVVCNLILPDMVILIVLVVVLGFNCYLTTTKGIEKYNLETESFRAAERDLSQGTERPEIELGSKKVITYGLTSSRKNIEIGEVSGTFGSAAPGSCESVYQTDRTRCVEIQNSITPPTGILVQIPSEAMINDHGGEVESKELYKARVEAATQFPLWALSAAAVMTAFSVAYAIVKNSYLNACTEARFFYLFLFVPIPVYALCMFAFTWFVRRRHRRRRDCGYTFLETDVVWSGRIVWVLPPVGLLAGFTAGLLGIGGGMIMGPLFVQMGLQPQVQAATSAYMVFWTGLSATFQYKYYNKISWNWILILVSIGFIDAQIGQRFINWYIKKYKRPSIIILILAMIIGIAIVALTIQQSIHIAHTWKGLEERFTYNLAWTKCAYYAPSYSLVPGSSKS